MVEVAEGLPEGSCTVAVFATLFPPAFAGGGPIKSTDALVKAAPPKYRQFVVASNRDLGKSDRLDVPTNTWVQRGNARVVYAPTDRLGALLEAFRMIRRQKPTVLYLNSFFNLQMSILPQLLARFGYWGRATRFLAPRGEFGAGALGRRTAKKNIFILFYRVLGLHHGLIWHASSEREAADIRGVWGEEAAVIVRENETLLPVQAEVPERSDSNHDVRLVFIGRVVEHKGLHVVLHALNDVVFPASISLDIYGSELDHAYVERCRRLAEALPESITVHFHGAVEPDAIPSVLRACDLLVLPTAGENFGHVIAEALSVGCAVMCADTTPWSAILRSGGGFVVPDRSTESWAKSIQDYLTLSPEFRSSLRTAVGSSYDRWRNGLKGHHVFELLEATVATSRKR